MRWNKLATAILLLVLALTVAGCTTGGSGPAPGTGEREEPGDGVYPLTITDDIGREVTLSARPERIVSLLPSLTEILFALDGGERVVGVTNWCNYPQEALSREKVGDLFSPNTEKILALEPDLILTGRSETLAETLAFLEITGIPYIVVDPQNFAEIAASVIRVAEIIDAPEQGQVIAEELQQGRAAMAGKLKLVSNSGAPSVFVLLDTEALYTVGDGEFLADMIAMAGGQNAAAGQGQGYIQLSEEVFFGLDPDIIICTFPMSKQVLAKPAWQDLQAVKNGRVYDVDGDLVSRPGPRILLGLEELFGVFFE